MDRLAIGELGVPGLELMERAGHAVYALARSRFPDARRWLVLCGAGNNAGDGYVIARLARAEGLAVTVVALSDPSRLAGDAAVAWQRYRESGGEVRAAEAGLWESSELIIDALLGTGASRKLDGEWLQAVELSNASGLPVLAVDLPSGLDGASGRPLGAALRATLTVTFIGRKLGLYVGAGPEYAGEICFDDLGLPLQELAAVRPAMRLFGTGDRRRCLPRRPREAHKGHFGHVLVVGGNAGMGGAVRLAAEAALRAGAGLVSVATRPQNVAPMLATRPELMCHGVEEAEGLTPLLERATLVAIGPGLGQDGWARALFERVMTVVQPLVVDADALNLLAEQPRRRDDWVLTPHPGEAGRLLGRATVAIQADRLQALAALSARYGGTVVLKGRGTLVGRADALPWLVHAGNPGMASGGMGDVLTGLVAGLMAQQPAADVSELAACAADIHARAADAAASDGERGLIASDLFGRLRPWLNPSS